MICESYSLSVNYEACGLTPPATPARLEGYLLNRGAANYLQNRRPALIVCPGGGYGAVCGYVEGEPIAMRFAGSGVQTFVLQYSVYPMGFPGALLELSAAVALVRSRAEEFYIDPDRIFVCGFSAGGHLTASLGVYWKEQFIRDALGFSGEENKPNGLILGYPVITGKPGITHTGSVENLMGSATEETAIHRFSLEEHVSPDTPPTFLWHTSDDDAVHVSNSLLFGQALRANNVPFEMHIFPHGPHGLGLSNDVTASWPGQLVEAAQCWSELAIKFIQRF